MTCCAPLTGISERCYDAGGGEIRRAVAMTCGCNPSGCDPEPATAEATGWILAPPDQNGHQLSATKTLPNGVVITATMTNRGPTGNAQSEFRPGTTQGDGNPNALLAVLTPGGEQFFTVDFTTDVVQGPDTRVTIYDLDNAGAERLLFPQSRYRRNADINQPIQGAQGIVWNGNGQFWTAAGASNRSSRLTFLNEPWGGYAGPLRVQFRKSSQPLVGTMFDFWGPINAVDCDDPALTWFDTITGAEVDPGVLAVCT